MFERDEADFEIMHDEKRKNFSLYVGTWSNSQQSFADVMFYLSLSDGSNRPLFYERLKEFNGLFIDNKDEIIADIEANGLNIMNSVLNEHDINMYLDEFSNDEQKEGYLKTNEQYIFNFEQADLKLEKLYKKEIIEMLEDSNDIVEAYNGMQEIKDSIKQGTFDNIFDYIFVE